MANGNFFPFAGRSLPSPVLPSRVEPAQSISGSGSPEGVQPGNPGQVYTDVDSGMLYLKITGTQTLGWQLIGAAVSAGSGGTGNNQILRYNGNPNGHLSLNGPGMVIDYSVSPPNVWIKETSGTANDEWELLIGG